MVNKNLFLLVFEDLLYPTQTIFISWHLLHFTLFKELQIALGIGADNHVQNIHLTECLIYHIDVPCVNRVELAENHAHTLILGFNNIQYFMQCLQLSCTWIFNFTAD